MKKSRIADRTAGRKAGTRVMSFYWIIIFVLIAIAVVSAALIYRSPYDVRKAEARILGEKLAECISKNGHLRKDNLAMLDSPAENLENVCGLVFEDTNYNENQFYISINIEGRKLVVFDKDGSGNYAAYCNEEGVGEKIPVCFKRKFFVLNEEENNKFVLVELIVAVGKINQNVK